MQFHPWGKILGNGRLNESENDLFMRNRDIFFYFYYLGKWSLEERYQVKKCKCVLCSIVHHGVTFTCMCHMCHVCVDLDYLSTIIKNKTRYWDSSDSWLGGYARLRETERDWERQREGFRQLCVRRTDRQTDGRRLSFLELLSELKIYFPISKSCDQLEAHLWG